MDARKDNFPSTRSWRDIPQEVKPRAMSKTGRTRYSMGIAKVVFGILFIAAAAWGTVALVNAFEYHPQQIAKATQSVPIKKLRLNTDGMLTRDWVLRTLGIPKNTSLTEIDLDVLKAKLIASGQVRYAMLGKSFPDTLDVTLTERSPVARIMSKEGDRLERELFVARDGVVFAGEGFEQPFIDQLPFIVAGVKLVRTKEGAIAPIPGMEVVSDLLTKARYEGGQLYSFFKHISLARLESDGAIEASSPECEGLVFNTREDFFRQLAYFDFLLDTLKPSSEAPLARVDLSLGRDVPVTFSKKPNLTVASGAPSTTRNANGKLGAAPQKPAVASRTPGSNPSSTTVGSTASSASGRQLQAPTRPSTSLPAFQNFQRNTTQREL